MQRFESSICDSADGSLLRSNAIPPTGEATPARGLTIPALLGCCTKAARTLCASGPVELLANLGRSRAQLRDNRVGQRERQRNDLVINEAGVVRRRRGTVEVPRDLKLGEPTDLCRSM